MTDGMAFEAKFEEHNGPYYLTPRVLRRAPTALRRVLLVGSCSAEQWQFHKKNDDDCAVDFIFTNNLAVLPEAPPQPAADYDFQIVQLAVRSVMRDDIFWKLSYADSAGHEALFTEVCGRLSLYLQSVMAWNIRFGILTFVSNFVVPMQNPMGRLQPRYDLRNPVYFFERLNQFLYEQVSGYANAHVVDLDQIAAAYGRKRTQEDAIGWLAHSTYLPHLPEDQTRLEPSRRLTEYYPSSVLDAMGAAWAQVMSMYRSLRQIDTVKLVVVDLDDTMWRGVIADTANIGPELIESPGWQMGMMEALGFLKKRGVLLAVISKNEESLIRGIWDKVFNGRFSLDDFAVVKINWLPKPENLAEILRVVNLLPRNVLYVDDNPVERSIMQGSFPDLRVLDGHHFFWKRSLLWSAETQPAHVTEESSRRTEMVRQQVEREAAKSVMSREEFLAKLGLTVEVRDLNSSADESFSRCFELVNKTNQFNTTGRRITQEECRGLFDGGGRFVFFKARDIYTDYGIIGVAICRGAHMEQFVMSCRVAGLDVEIAVMRALVATVRSAGASAMTADFVNTDANFLCRDFLSKCGFVLGGGQWVLDDLGSKPVPAHIRLLRI